MADMGIAASRTSRFWVGLTLFGLLAAVVGFVGSLFGPYYPATIGFALVVIGLAVVGRRRSRGQVLLVIGGGILVGAVIYVALAIFAPSAPAYRSCTGGSAASEQICTDGAARR